MALAVTITSVCSEPEDRLAPGSDHRSISPLFFRELGSKLAPGYSGIQAVFEVDLSHFLTRS